jgi:phosphoribosylformimino-5-aminoimidazole carboxamide ribotide isomerase
VRVIGVIDLKGGKAVHARGGSRELYEPVHSVLLSGDQKGDAIALTRAYRDRLGLREIYVADLDCITDGGQPSETLHAIAAIGIPLMVDAGVSSTSSAAAVLATGARRVVVGLETLTSLQELARVVNGVGPSGVVFSLDLRNGEALTRPDGALVGVEPITVARDAVGCGIRSVLVLDLARVGGGGGPAVSLIEKVRAACPTVELIAGGGVRDGLDIDRLAAIGCDAALVGTALHQPAGLGSV